VVTRQARCLWGKRDQRRYGALAYTNFGKLDFEDWDSVMWCPRPVCGIPLRVGFRECPSCTFPIELEANPEITQPEMTPLWQKMIELAHGARGEQRERRARDEALRDQIEK
jgi:hypothetical protein